jgi:hypothetical protein
MVPIEQLWRLAQAWYHNRLEGDYSGRSREDVMQIFRAAGLITPFWIG